MTEKKKKCKLTIAGTEVDADQVISRFHDSCTIDQYKNVEATVALHKEGTVGLTFKNGFMVETYKEMYLVLTYIQSKHYLPPFHVTHGFPDGLIIKFDEDFVFDSFEQLHDFLKYFSGMGKFLVEQGRKIGD